MRTFATALFTLCACLPRVGPLIDGGPPPDGGTGGGSATTDGGCAPACALGVECAGPLDCASGVCTASRCADPALACNGAFSGCTSFVDLTSPAALREVRFPQGGDRYSPSCIRVRFGQSVTFAGGSLNQHPLRQACGPTPGLLAATSGSSKVVTFDAALGLYGYYCDTHGSMTGSGMAGAIDVVR